MRLTLTVRRLLAVAPAWCAAGLLGAGGVGCTHLRQHGYSVGRNLDPMTQAFRESEGTAAPGELAGDFVIDGPGGPVLLPGGSSMGAAVACPSCGPGGCGAGCPLALHGRPTGPRLAAAGAVDAGRAAERANRPDLAVGHYRRALLNDPAAADAHHRLAVLLDQSGSYAAAEQHYAAALDARPGDVDLLCDVGYSYLLQGRTDDAEDRFRTALAQRPDHVRSLENLGLLYAKQNDRTRAAAVLARTGTQADVEAKLAVLFPAGRPANGYVSPPDVPLWAGVAPDDDVVTRASATAGDGKSDHGAFDAVQTADRVTRAARPVSLLLTEVPWDEEDANDEDADAFDTLEPPAVPPPSVPADDLPTWGGVRTSDDLPLWNGAAPTADPTVAPASHTRTASAPATPAAYVKPAAPADELPLWPPVGGFSAAR